MNVRTPLTYITMTNRLIPVLVLSPLTISHTHSPGYSCTSLAQCFGVLSRDNGFLFLSSPAATAIDVSSLSIPTWPSPSPRTSTCQTCQSPPQTSSAPQSYSACYWRCGQHLVDWHVCHLARLIRVLFAPASRAQSMSSRIRIPLGYGIDGLDADTLIH
jgi:hypothetical protein